MGTATTLPGAAPEPVQRLFTVADLAALPDELPSGPVLYELDNAALTARIAEMPGLSQH